MAQSSENSGFGEDRTNGLAPIAARVRFNSEVADARTFKLENTKLRTLFRVVLGISIFTTIFSFGRYVHRFYRMESFIPPDPEEDSLKIKPSARIFNNLLGIIVDLAVPTCGILGCTKKNQAFLMVNEFGSVVLAVWSWFMLLFRAEVTGYYEQEKTAFSDCKKGESCFHVYVILIVLWSGWLLFGVIFTEKLLKEMKKERDAATEQDVVFAGRVETAVVTNQESL